MINPLRLTEKQVIIISIITVVVGLAAMSSLYSYAAGTGDMGRNHIYEPTVQADNENGREPIQVNIKENETPQAPQDAPKPTEQTKPATNPAAAKKPAQATAAQPEPAKKKPGGHIEFTNKNVTPGDPQSYVYTVGQCPFYEMAGAKGCAPPSDIICNDDWTVCKPK